MKKYSKNISISKYTGCSSTPRWNPSKSVQSAMCRSISDEKLNKIRNTCFVAMSSIAKCGKYMFQVFKIFGLATMSLYKYKAKNNASPRTLFIYSYRGSIYNFIFILILIFAGMYKVKYCKSKVADQSRLNNVIDFFGNFIIYTVSVVLLFKFIISQRLAVDIGNKLYLTDLILEKFDLKYKEKSIAVHQMIVLLFDFLIWFVIIVVGIYCTSLTEAVLLHVPNFIINSLIIQYVIVIIYLYGMISTINNKFRKFIGDASSRMLLKKFSRIQLSVQYLTEVEELIALRELCLNIYDMSDDVSTFYSFPILVCITKLFFSIILNTYFFIKPSIFGGNIVTSIDDIFSICWLTLDTYSIVILTQYITMTVNEMKKTGDIIHRVLQHSTNCDINKQLSSFSSHLFHKNVQFTAMNMFCLDCTLLQSVIGSITTYLVILIQFQEDNKHGEKLCNSSKI